MRFVCGPIPPSRVLNPQAEGWTPLREWGAGRLAVFALLLGLPFLLAALNLLVTLYGQNGPVRGLLRTQPLLGGGYLLALLAMVPVHELIHGLAYGQGIGSPHLIVGVLAEPGPLLAIYDSPMPRNRVLGVLAAPFLTLSLLPLLCLPWLEGTAWSLVLAYSLLHAAICGGDLIVFLRLVSQVPRMASIHNNGWQTYWIAQGGSGHAERRTADGD